MAPYQLGLDWADVVRTLTDLTDAAPTTRHDLGEGDAEVPSVTVVADLAECEPAPEGIDGEPDDPRGIAQIVEIMRDTAEGEATGRADAGLDDALDGGVGEVGR